jgi:methylisocitrate lyase
VTLDHFCRIIREVHLSSGLPVIADADTGFGEGEMVAKTVWEYFSAGASGMLLVIFT